MSATVRCVCYYIFLKLMCRNPYETKTIYALCILQEPAFVVLGHWLSYIYLT